MLQQLQTSRSCRSRNLRTRLDAQLVRTSPLVIAEAGLTVSGGGLGAGGQRLDAAPHPLRIGSVGRGGDERTILSRGIGGLTDVLERGAERHVEGGVVRRERNGFLKRGDCVALVPAAVEGQRVIVTERRRPSVTRGQPRRTPRSRGSTDVRRRRRGRS